MSTAVLVVFGVLWLAALALAGLVLIVYRELDGAYARTEASLSSGGLTEGSRPAPLLVVGPGGTEELRLADETGTRLVGIVSTDCSACEATMASLQEGLDGAPETIVLITGSQRKFVEYGRPGLTLHWVHNTADLQFRLGVTVVPTLYLLRDGAVVDSTTDGSPGAIEELVRSNERGAPVEAT